MNVASCKRQVRQEAYRWLPVLLGKPASRYSAPESGEGAKACLNGRALMRLASKMLCLGAVCLMAAGVQTALARDNTVALQAGLVPVACAAGCVEGDASATLSTCGGVDCKQALPSRLAASKRAGPALAVRPSAQAPVAAFAVDGGESLFTGTGDMSAGSWSRP